MKRNEYVYKDSHNIFLSLMTFVTILYRKSKLKNKDFTIICNNCSGGLIYRLLDLEFTTPTTDLWISKNDFSNFCNNLKTYCDVELEEAKKEELSVEFKYPVGVLRSDNLPDVYLYFSHMKTFEEAKKKWDRRKKRINYDNIFVIYDTHMYCQDIDLKNFQNIKYDNKVIFVNKELSNKVDKHFVFSFYNEKYNGNTFFKQSLNFPFIFFNIEEFDYINWLNSGKIMKNKHFKYKEQV